MTLTAVLLAAAEQQEEELNFYTVSPGLPGFITFFLFAVAGWLLFRSMTRHVRKVQLRAQAERAEQAELAATEARAAGGNAGDARGDAGGAARDAGEAAQDAGEAAQGADDAAAGRP